MVKVRVSMLLVFLVSALHELRTGNTILYSTGRVASKQPRSESSRLQDWIHAVSYLRDKNP